MTRKDYIEIIRKHIPLANGLTKQQQANRELRIACDILGDLERAGLVPLPKNWHKKMMPHMPYKEAIKTELIYEDLSSLG